MRGEGGVGSDGERESKGGGGNGVMKGEGVRGKVGEGGEAGGVRREGE